MKKANLTKKSKTSKKRAEDVEIRKIYKKKGKLKKKTVIGEWTEHERKLSHKIREKHVGNADNVEIWRKNKKKS